LTREACHDAAYFLSHPIDWHSLLKKGKKRNILTDVHRRRYYGLGRITVLTEGVPDHRSGYRRPDIHT